MASFFFFFFVWQLLKWESKLGAGKCPYFKGSTCKSGPDPLVHAGCFVRPW